MSAGTGSLETRAAPYSEVRCTRSPRSPGRRSGQLFRRWWCSMCTSGLAAASGAGWLGPSSAGQERSANMRRPAGGPKAANRQEAAWFLIHYIMNSFTCFQQPGFGTSRWPCPRLCGSGAHACACLWCTRVWCTCVCVPVCLWYTCVCACVCGIHLCLCSVCVWYPCVFGVHVCACCTYVHVWYTRVCVSGPTGRGSTPTMSGAVLRCQLDQVMQGLR